FYFLTVVEGAGVEQTSRNYGWSGGWEGISTWGLSDRVVEEARSMHRSLTEGKKSPEGKMDLVAGPQVAGIASHESCGHPTEADRVLGREAAQAGKSFIPPDGLGMRVGSELVTVVDDPTVEHAIAYYLTDDEGVKARRRYLYKEGRVTEFLQNRETAAALGTHSNGASRAVNYNVEAIVRMANTFVEPKDHTLEELLEDVKFGVYMKSFMEWNIDDKRYNAKYAGREAYLIDVVENRSYQIRFARNEAVISNQWRESNASVFVVHGKRVVASDVRDLSKTDEAVERLVKIAKTSQANPDYAGIAKGPFRYARTRPDPKVLSLHEGGKYVEAAVGGALDQGAKECAGSFWKYEDEHFLATSNGAEGHDHRASL